MTFKKIWNALTSDLREDLWNELTDEQKVRILEEHSEDQTDRFYEKLTPALTDQADKWILNNSIIVEIMVNIRRKGKCGIPKYLNSNIENPKIEESEYDELFAASHKIFSFYTASFAHVLIFQKSVDLTPQEIIDLELKYFWKDNESLEKQKEDWHHEVGQYIKLKKANHEDYEIHTTGERLTEPYPATENDIALEFRDRFLLGFDENEQEHNS
ncbi:MAG: hypothetical protein CXT78_15800 [Thaumarchaeota archaeon]|jgi:hypothetical protein|nr:MAG: hypothetical protein CXT78_15800 [Nitrososphaerota archaeon]